MDFYANVDDAAMDAVLGRKEDRSSRLRHALEADGDTPVHNPIRNSSRNTQPGETSGPPESDAASPETTSERGDG
jgi:hypothetical protein